jgi:hypothetical protein
MQEPCGKGASDSILTLSLAGGIVGCRSKRRQGHRRAGRWSSERCFQGPGPVPRRGRPHDRPLETRVARRACGVEALCTPRRNLHENRETSRLSRVSIDRDRVAKANCRTAALHSREESDCTVVPVTRLNTEERSSAEVGEERVQPKENIAHARTPPTQRGDRRVPGRVRGAAPPGCAANIRGSSRMRSLRPYGSVGGAARPASLPRPKRERNSGIATLASVCPSPKPMNILRQNGCSSVERDGVPKTCLRCEMLSRTCPSRSGASPGRRP